MEFDFYGGYSGAFRGWIMTLASFTMLLTLTAL